MTHRGRAPRPMLSHNRFCQSTACDSHRLPATQLLFGQYATKKKKKKVKRRMSASLRWKEKRGGGEGGGVMGEESE